MNAGLPLNSIETPCFVVDLSLLRRNLAVLDDVQKRTGAKILLAQKAFSMFGVYPMLAKVLHGTCASSPHEAELGRDCFPGEVHAFAAAYSERDLRELLPVCDHIIFNSFSQWNRYRPLAMQYADRVEFGLRVNPEHSEADVPIYDPCAPAPASAFYAGILPVRISLRFPDCISIRSAKKIPILWNARLLRLKKNSAI